MKTSLLLSLLFFPSLLFSQVLLEEWSITKEGAQMAKDVAWGVDLDASGNIYWATSQTNFGGNIKDIYTYKVNPDGDEIWTTPHVFGDNREQQAYNCVFQNGIVYVAGRTWTGPLITSSNALVYAIDTALQDTLWTYIWDGGFGYEEVDGLVIESDAIFISGWTWGDTTNQDAFITKLDLNGQHQWTTTWGSSNYDQCDGHCVVDDSTVYICGLYDLSSGGDAYLAAFDKINGAYKWHQFWGGNNTEDALGMESDGTYLYQCGTTSSFGDSTVFINKYDKSGNLLWTALTEKAIKARSLAFSNNGDLYLAATSNTLGAGGEDLIIIRYHAGSGDLLDYRTWGGIEDEVVHDIKIKGDFMYLTGRTISFSANDDFDAFLIKAALFGPTSSQEIHPVAGSTLVFPNPTTQQFRLDLPALGTYSLQLYNATGHLQLSMHLLSGQTPVNVRGLGPGWYIWHAKSIVGKRYQGKVLIQH